MENSLIIYLQKSPIAVFSFMNIVSFPFHLKFFIIIIIVLFYENLIDSNQFFLLLFGQLINGALKYLVKRKRPYMQNNKINNLERLKLDYYSFPSGHTFNAFLLFYILRDNGIINNYFKIIPYLVGLSRITLGVHYPTDIIAGAILAKLVISFYNHQLSLVI
jgi:undecaprenyl-diphosphatase